MMKMFMVKAFQAKSAEDVIAKLALIRHLHMTLQTGRISEEECEHVINSMY